MKKTAIITLTFNKLEEATKPFLNSYKEFKNGFVASSNLLNVRVIIAVFFIFIFL